MLETHGCEIATEVRWALGDQNFLTFDFTSIQAIPDCNALDPTFVTWLEQMRDTGAEFALHADAASGLWTRNGDRVTRLAFAEEVVQG